MTDRLDAFARRLSGDPFFLASALQEYARSEGLDRRSLAAFLGCSPETLGPLGLCRRPRADVEGLREDLALISGRFPVTADALAEVVRRAEVLESLRQARSAGEIAAAARDRSGEDEP